MNRSLLRFARTLLQAMPGRALLSLGLILAVGVTEGAGLLVLIPLLQIAGLDAGQGEIGGVAGYVEALLGFLGAEPSLSAVLALGLILTVFRALLLRRQSLTSGSIEFDFEVRLRERLYRAIARSDWLTFTRTKASELTHLLTTETERCGSAAYLLLSLSASLILTAVYIAFALYLSPFMTAGALVCGGGMVVLLKTRNRVARQAGEGLSAAMNGLFGAISEHLGGMKVVKSFGADDRHIEIFSRSAREVRGKYRQVVRSQATAKLWFDVGSALILVSALYIAFAVLELPAAEVLLLLFVFSRILPRISGLQGSFLAFLSLLPSYDRILEAQKKFEAAEERGSRNHREIDMAEGVFLKGASFTYGGDPVLRELDLTISAGGATALVGPSGAGKTTVADLVMGLLRPNKGSVLIDRKPLEPEELPCWRALVGYVPQEAFLFHDTVRENLLWASPGATEEELWEALGMASAVEFVSRMPEGLDTVVGDRGTRLSGGERQRLALARALLRKPALLILDEATNALDGENERHVLEVVERLRGRVTMLLISHRLSAVRIADVIHVLDRGRVAQSGMWGSLMEDREGPFCELFRAQIIEEGRLGQKNSFLPGAGTQF